jgi:hypothetical protein
MLAVDEKKSNAKTGFGNRITIIIVLYTLTVMFSTGTVAIQLVLEQLGVTRGMPTFAYVYIHFYVPGTFSKKIN